MQEPIVKSILHPTVRILSTARFTFPNGILARIALAEKCLEAMFTLSLRLGSVITKNHLAVPIQRFFLAFDKAFSENLGTNGPSDNPGQKASAMYEHFVDI
jgi:WD repeat-containing protein 81